MKAEPVRTDVHTPLIWGRPRRDEPLTDVIRRVARQNPIFCDHELAAKGPQFLECLPRMATTGIIKRQGTHVYSSNVVDQSHPDVSTLLLLTCSSATTAAKLEKHASRLIEIESRMASKAALAPTADNLSKMRRRVFDFDDAAEYLKGDPSDAIAKLVSANYIIPIHPRMYRKPGVTAFGPEMEKWVVEHAERDRLVQQSIDASARHSAGLPKNRTTLRVTSMSKDFAVKRSQKRAGRIYVNFNHLGAVYGIAGGPNKEYIIWNSITRKTKLTAAAAARIALEMFPRFMRWGDLIAMVDTYAKDKKQVLLPSLENKGMLDQRPRGRERAPRPRYDALREIDREKPLINRPCILYIDMREDKSIIDALTGIGNLKVEQVKLTTCDFHAQWAEGELFVERKTNDDYVASMIDGRLQRQTERMAAMKAEGKAVYMMTQGYIFRADPTEVGIYANGPKMPSGRKIMDTTIEMAMLGIPTIAGDTWMHAAEAILRLVVRSMGSLPVEEARPTNKACSSQANIAAEPPAVPSSV